LAVKLFEERATTISGHASVLNKRETELSVSFSYPYKSPLGNSNERAKISGYELKPTEQK
jgi:hypothetical protein